MKNIKHLLSIHAARFAVLLAVLAPAALVKGQIVYPPPTVLPAFTNGDFETGDFTGWTLTGGNATPMSSGWTTVNLESRLNPETTKPW